MKTLDVWERYNKDLYHFIASRVTDLITAEEILQEVFLKLHVQLSRKGEIKQAKAYTFAIARNCIIDFYRKNKTVELDSLNVVDDTDESLIDSTHSREDCLKAIIGNLPEKYKRVIYLHEIQGKKSIEISEILKLPLSTVKSQLLRARKKIQLGFMDCCDLTLDDKGVLRGEIQEKENCKVCCNLP